MDLDDREEQSSSGFTVLDGQTTGDVVAGERQVQESSNNGNNTVAQEKADI